MCFNFSYERRETIFTTLLFERTDIDIFPALAFAFVGVEPEIRFEQTRQDTLGALLRILVTRAQSFGAGRRVEAEAFLQLCQLRDF